MVQAIPEGVGNIVPYLSVRGATKAIKFYQAAFGAELMTLMPMGEDLVAHADLKIGSSRLYLADEMPGFGAVKSPKALKGTSVNIHLWVEDCDAAFKQAVAAGARVLMPLTDQFWGDRFGMVGDPFGHVWAISSQKEDLTPEELARRSEEAMATMAPPPPAKKPKSKSKAKSEAKAGKKARTSKPEKKSKPQKKDKKDKKKGKRG